MQRVSVVGVTGSGKTTVAERLAAHLGGTHHDLDALNWQDGWTEVEAAVFEARVTAAAAGDCWVIGGNYSRVQPIVWQRADTVVWLDLPFRTVLRRLVARTTRRVVTRQRLWGTDNRESLRRAFSSNSIIWWLLKTFRRTRRRYPGRFTDPRWTHLDIVHLRTRREVAVFLAMPDEAAIAFAYPRAP